MAFLSFFTALARSFDCITDPFMGWFSDKTQTRWGRRRPFMFLGCWFYALLFILLFIPPQNTSDKVEGRPAAQIKPQIQGKCHHVLVSEIVYFVFGCLILYNVEIGLSPQALSIVSMVGEKVRRSEELNRGIKETGHPLALVLNLGNWSC